MNCILYIIVFIYFKNIKISNMIVYKVHKICYEVHIICEYIFKMDCATSYIKRLLKVVKPSINIIFRKLIFQNIYVIYKICYELYIIVFYCICNIFNYILYIIYYFSIYWFNNIL